MDKTATIEIPDFTGPDIEAAYARAMSCQRRRERGPAEAGMRLARARHPVYMKTLEKCAEHMMHMVEDQYGRSIRDPGTPYSYRVCPTEAGLFREAYRVADEGHAMEHFQWIYAAAAWLSGLYK